MNLIRTSLNGRAPQVTRPFALPRRGFSLLELLAVVVLLGILAAVAAAQLAPGIAGNLASGTDAFRVLSALRAAREGAIATGEEHRVRMLSSGGSIGSFQIERLGSTTTIVEGPYNFSSDVIINQSGGDATFDFQGEATVAPVITFAGPDRTYRITVVAATGWGLLEEL